MTTEEVKRMLINPFYTINLAPIMGEPHETLVERDLFISAQKKLIEELGPDQYFETLLDVLSKGA